MKQNKPKEQPKQKNNKHPHNKRSMVLYYILLGVTVVLAFLFLPGSFVKENQGALISVVTGIGLDREKDSSDYHITVQIVTPDISGQNQQKVASFCDKGKTIVDALNNASLKIGKTIGFDHCSVIAIGESLTGENIFPLLDHFYRRGNISLNTVLVNVKGSACDLITQTTEVSNLSSGNIQNNFTFNQNFFGSSKISTLGMFFNEYFKRGKSVIVAEINMKEDETKTEAAGNEQCGDSSKTSSSGAGDKGSSGGGSSSSSSEGSGSEELQKVNIIQNQGESIVYKEGKAVARANNQVNYGFNYLDNRVKYGILSGEHINDDNLHDATVTMLISNSTVDFKPVVDKETNRFVLKANIKLYGEITEICCDNTEKISRSYKDLLTDEVKTALEKKVKEDVDVAVQFCKLNNVDPLNIEDYFYKLKTKDYKEMIKKLAINNNFLEYCTVEASVEVFHQD